MGGTMPYARVRGRNGMLWRPTEHPDPYPHNGTEWKPQIGFNTLLGDFNRFERDVLGIGWGAGTPAADDLAQEYAEAAGVDVETVRKVLRAVFTTPDYYNVNPIKEFLG